MERIASRKRRQTLPKIKQKIKSYSCYPVAPMQTTANKHLITMELRSLLNEKKSGNYRKMFEHQLRGSPQLFNPMILIMAVILLTFASQVLCISTSSSSADAAADTTVGRTQDPPAAVAKATPATSIASNQQRQQAAISVSEPRQYFKIHITPGTKQGHSKRAAIKEASSSLRRSGSMTAGGGSAEHQETGKQKQISNATLKKLLNQSLIKASNGSLVSPKASNFKLMFIQRASPGSHKLHKDSRQKDSSGAGSSPSPVEQSTPSLAASVSKHFATTLLSSASDIMANLSSVPSLTSLATQIVVHSLDTHRATGDKQSTNESASSNSVEKNPISFDHIKKVSSSANSIESEKRKNANKPKQPSKVYNLPVKFVSNGQPNLVVFNTIRRHFATIKKLQNERQKFSTSFSIEQGKNNNTKRNKPRQHQSQVHKLKGNSRFIYLPLKYLSNAKPNKVLIGKTQSN